MNSAKRRIMPRIMPPNNDALTTFNMVYPEQEDNMDGSFARWEAWKRRDNDETRLQVTRVHEVRHRLW